MKQAIVVRKDLKMSCGKIAGQVAHASLRSFWDVYDFDPYNKCGEWIDMYNETKIILKVHSEKEICDIKQKCIDEEVGWATVHDVGKTQIGPDTLTAIGIGPDKHKKINKIIEGLKLL